MSVTPAGGQGNSASYGCSISHDGRFVAFSSFSVNLVAGDTNGKYDVFVRDRQSGTTERVSMATGGAQGNGDSQDPSMSSDGRFVAFWSLASNLVVGDSNATWDVFVHDRQSGTTELVSIDSAGVQGNGASTVCSMSADGRLVAFQSNATNVVAGDTNATADIFVHDRQSGTTERVSVDLAGAQGNDGSIIASISADGRFVAFTSYATNLVAGDTNGFGDIFVHDRGQPPIVASCFGDGTGAICRCGNNGLAGHGCENSASTGGAVLTAAGSASLSSDTLVLTSSGEISTAVSLVFQGDATTAGVNFGDGVRCVHGNLKRLYLRNASGGVISAPQPGDPSISMRSAGLGDPIPTGATRHYQTYYHDPSLAFCASPVGDTWNVTNALSAVWSP